MPAQLPLDLVQRPALGRAAFLVSASNATALSQVDAWENWPAGKLVLYGATGAGKTHLAHVWAESTGAEILDAQSAELPVRAPCIVLEDVDRIGGDRDAEERLFHLHNAVLASPEGRLLMTGCDAPTRWGIALPDLRSRIVAAATAKLDPPDEALLTGVLVKLFDDRGLRVTPTVVHYLATRIERSIAAAERVVAALDARSLATKKPVGLGLARALLEGDGGGVTGQ